MAFGATLTLPTITGSHSDFPVLLKTADFPSAAIDGTANAIDNGGGNLRAYTDSGKGTQLSVEVSTFVSSGSPVAEVWVNIPTAATSNTIFIEADSVASSQPATGASFGRDSAWTGYFFVTTDGGTTDSTGNLTMSATGSPSTQVNDWGGVAKGYTDSDYYLSGTVSGYTTSDPITMHAWQKQIVTSSANIILSLSDQSATNQQLNMAVRTGTSSLGRSFNVSNFDTEATGLTSSLWQAVTVRFESSVTSVFANGGGKVTGTFNNPTGLDRIGVATTSDSTPFQAGSTYIGFGYVFDGARDDNFIATEYDNQSAASNWVTVGAWVDSGGGGVTIPIFNKHYRSQGMM